MQKTNIFNAGNAYFSHIPENAVPVRSRSFFGLPYIFIRFRRKRFAKIPVRLYILSRCFLNRNAEDDAASPG